jgi:Glycosyl hydrolases family 25
MVFPGLFYPDISVFQGVMDLSGLHAVCIKVSEGTGYLNPHYADQVAKANADGAFHFAYHFLTDDDPKAQAQFCFGHLGSHVGLMVDVETQTKTQSKPSLQQNVAFVKDFRALGGIVHLNYLPHWYWHDVWGGPDLAPLKDLGLALVSSNFTHFGTHAGWVAYGGWAPTIWQYSENTPLHGQHVDFNAFLGSGATHVPTLVEEFKSLVMTGKLAGKTGQEMATSGSQTLSEIAAASHMTPAQILRTTATHYGRYDQVTHDFLDNVFSGQISGTAKVPAGAKLWVLK